jgi:hypothetical protein
VRAATWRGDLAKRPTPPTPAWQPASVTREQLQLSLTERKGLNRHGQPVSSGVPLPQGQLWNPASVRLLGPAGQEKPLQTGVLSRWPDGSIRWLLLDFQADLASGETNEYLLEYGSEITRSSGSGVSAKEDDETISIDTGPLEVSFGKDGRLIRSVRVDGESWEGVVSPEIVLQGVGGLTISTNDTPYTLEIEEAGSDRAVVRVQGEIHRVQGEETLNFAYDMRFHFYRDSGIIRIDPTITNLLGWEPHIGLSHTDLTSVSLRLPRWLGRENAILRVGTDNGPISGQGSCFRLLQSDPNTFEVVADGQQLATGHRAAGCVDLHSGNRRLGVGVRHFWEQSPKGIVVDDKGDLLVDLWTEQTRPLVMGGGEAKRHELYISLGDTDIEALPGMLDPLRAVAPTEWYSASGGFGRPFLLVEEDELPLYDAHVGMYEAFVQKGYEQLMENQAHFGEYGWRNFGDWSTTWDIDGWGNCEYDLAYVYFQQFARTGDLAFFDLAETTARHWMDVDLIWAANNLYWLGGGLQHSEAHRHYAAADHTWSQGLLEYYHLTGDRRSLEAALAVGDFFAHLALERPNQRRPRVGQLPSKDLPTRNPGWALIALVALYESTSDPYYLEAASAVVDILAEEQQSDGQWTYRIPANEIESRPIATKPFMTAIILRGLGDYHRITQDAKAAEMLVRGLTFLVEELWSPHALGYPYIDDPQYSAEAGNTSLLLLDAFAYAYELTADRRFLEVAVQGFQAAIQRQSGRLESSNLGKIVAQALRHTPQSLAVLMQPKEMILRGPGSVSVARAGATGAAVTITRLHTAESLRGTLTTQDLPHGLRVIPPQIAYVLEPGEKQTSLQLAIEPSATTPPGSYELVLADTAHDELMLSLPVIVPGWRVVDDFRPPQVHGWFGEAAFQVCEEQSQGWQYSTTDAEHFFSDAHRLYRNAASEEYLIYDAPGLFDFALTFYAPVSRKEQVAAQIQVCMITDQTHPQAIPTELAWTMPSTGEYAMGVITPKERVFRGDGKLKVTVAAGGDPVFPQLGRLEISGWQ